MPASVGHPGASAHAEYRAGWADARDGSAANQLARRLAEYGRIDELRTEVGAGAPTAGSQLLDLLTALGQTEQPGNCGGGLNPDSSIATPEDVTGG